MYCSTLVMLDAKDLDIAIGPQHDNVGLACEDVEGLFGGILGAGFCIQDRIILLQCRIWHAVTLLSMLWTMCMFVRLWKGWQQREKGQKGCDQVLEISDDLVVLMLMVTKSVMYRFRRNIFA